MGIYSRCLALSQNFLCPKMAATLRKRAGKDLHDSSSDSPYDGKENAVKAPSNEKRISLVEFAFLCLCITLLVALACLPHFHLPRPKTVKESKETDFTAEKARTYLEGLTKLGARTVGSYANDVQAVDYLMKEIYNIIAHTQVYYHVHVDVQTASGGFMLNFLHKNFAVAYENITNIIVHIHPKSRKETDPNVLLNCHFDTQPRTEGASDDAVSCAMMLEIMRAISRSPPRTIKNGIVFLFNGAEEGILEGSHAFVTKHKLASTIKAFVNLEAAGSGGREIVFQTGPGHPWLIHTYASSSQYPYASIVGQEIFQSGIIPSDTDFRIFRDYGNLVGIDIAYASNGYVYHTRHDNSSIIPDGSIQRGGENVLAVIKALSKSPFLTHEENFKHGKTAYFDFLGAYMILIPESLLTLVSIGSIGFSLLYILAALLEKNTVQDKFPKNVTFLSFIIAIVTIVCSWTSAIFVSVLDAVILTKLGCSLSWYSHPWFALVLYGSPALATILLVHIGVRKIAKKFGISFGEDEHEPEIYENNCILAHMLLVSIVVALMTYKGILSSFLVVTYLVFPLIFHGCIRPWMHKNGQNDKFYTTKLLLIHILAVSFPIILSTYHVFSLFDVFIPIMGRQGSEIPPDIVFAVLSSFVVIIITLYLTSLTHLVEKAVWIVKITGFIAIVSFHFALLGIMFPYSGSHPVSPKRIFLQHVVRNFHNKDGFVYKNDSGIWFAPLDYLGLKPVMHLPSLKDVASVECDGPYCGYPYFFPMRRLLKKTWYLKGPPPFKTSIKLSSFRIIKQETLENGNVKFQIRVKGPDHMTLLVTPNEGNQLVQWSVTDEPPSGQQDYDGRMTFYTYYAHGFHAKPWDFWLEFEVSGEREDESIADVAVAGHYLHGPLSTTKWMQKIVREFPSWVVDVAFVSSYDVWRL